LLGSLFGSNTNAVTSALAGYAGIKPQSANSLLSMAAPMVLGVLGKSVRGGGLNMSSLASLLSSQKGAISAALPTGLNLDRYLAAPSAAMAAVAAPAAKSSIWRWLLPLLLVLGALLLLSRCMKKDEVVQSLPAPAPQAEVAPAPLPAPVEVALPRADVFFDVAKTELPADAGTALAGVIAYLVANPTSMAVVSGYHDPTGDLATNEELAKNRALAVRGALVAGGVTAARIDLQKPVVSTGDGSLEAARRVEVTIR
jgi:outer membrane protein OmpA-like peptidoglycan-associated protein